MKRLLIQPDIHDWRTHARTVLQEGFAPDEVDLVDAAVLATLPLALEPADPLPTGIQYASPHVPRSFLESADFAATHRSPDRWNLLYRLLYRLQTQPELLRIEVDTEVAQLRSLVQQVRRDLHKMHAFVRFRKITADPMDDANPFSDTAPASTEHFVSWYQPDHRILRLAAPFFAERFAVMQWTILTPDDSVAWNPTTQQLTFGPGVPQEQTPHRDQTDNLETLWRSYYSSIFNPARLNTSAMKNEMPVRYWRNLPEIDVVPNLITQSANRVGAMVQTQALKPSAAPFVPAEHTLPVLNAALPTCKGCDLYLHATQVVPGAAPSSHPSKTVELMMVGEQPGDQEDRAGKPFIGPAGRVLDRALEELGIDRATVYVTNAVKHFKFIQRGKVRLHQNPRMSEITACRPWLLAEIDALKPRVILCLGASASKSLLGGTFALMRDHGKILPTPYADQVVATIHPSAVLRARDAAAGEQLYTFLKDDLALAYHAALHGSALQPDVTAV